MGIFSHSRLKAFEQCQLKYKFRYIDMLESKIEQSVEAFLGEMVHLTLEKLYKDLKFQKLNSLQELLEHFNAEWKKNWNPGIIIVRESYTEENYKKMGEQFVKDYYFKHYPFDDGKVIGLEHKVMIKLDTEGRYTLQGFIDRLMTTGDGKYEIHDYKTNANLPYEEYLKEDRQLALYALAVLNNYQDAKDVKLIWHFLAFDKSIVLQKTREDLEKLKTETMRLIDKINSTTAFEPRKSNLCDWCEFRPVCPEWKHIYKTENLPVNEFLDDPGVVLVNKYVGLQEEKKKHCDRIDEQLEKIKEAMISLCEKEGALTLNGSDQTARIWVKDVLKLPGKSEEGRGELETLIRESDLWNKFSQLDTFLLAKIVQEKKLPPILTSQILQFAKKEKVERVYLKKKNLED
ncbi:MAG: PD-(D/E)XK nuclease family protein [Candidatus Aenigmarchaeota archaeon]|nr:PD-(D/E)XK nuclease family protein [Candidatus Aenigmarchaeota archaeon]